MKLVIVTATTDLDRSRTCRDSWGTGFTEIVVVNGCGEELQARIRNQHTDATYLCTEAYLGTVPAFQAGVDYALEKTDADLIACFHDDLELLDPEWAKKTIRHFETHLACGLAGFGGAIGLGDENIYRVPYEPVQLARKGFRSNLVDAEVHGLRSLLPEKVACLDGFSLVGHRGFYKGWQYPNGPRQFDRPWHYFADHGIIHHAYDSLMGAYAKRLGWDVWYLPIRARHYGGQTAVGDQGYQSWAQAQILGGDQGFWQQSHQRGYELFHDVLPLRV